MDELMNYLDPEDDDEDEDDYDYEPSDPDSVGTFINEVES